MSEPEIVKPQELLDEIRWKADMIVVSPTYGWRVWLKATAGGVTDCCMTTHPCEYHARMTHPAPGSQH